MIIQDSGIRKESVSDPGVKEHSITDPGSGSATLLVRTSMVYRKVSLGRKQEIQKMCQQIDS
jgi:hypothetical protein